MHKEAATLEIAVEGEPLRGVLTDSRGQGRPFAGWIELASAIEDWRQDTRRALAGHRASTDHDAPQTSPSYPD
jgi:hypothetical protein